MKAKTLTGVVILILLASLSYASTSDCLSSSSFNGNLNSQTSGYIFPYAFKQGTDTTYVSDTSDQTLDVRDCLRLAVQYQWTMYNAFCSAAGLDSIKTRTAYIWSNDGSQWFRLDSSAAVTDTSWHSDTLIVRPFRYLRIIGYPSKAQTSVADSSGHPITILNLIPDNAYYRRMQWIVTPFFGNKR